jgi:hypothetical protein
VLVRYRLRASGAGRVRRKSLSTNDLSHIKKFLKKPIDKDDIHGRMIGVRVDDSTNY